MAKSKIDDEPLFDEVELEDEGDDVISPDTEKVQEEIKLTPAIDSPGWSPWVLSQCEQDEKDEYGNPTVDALVRLTKVLMGRPSISHGTLLATPHVDNEFRAVGQHHLVITVTKNLQAGESPYIIDIMALADAYADNIKGVDFKVFATTMAATRAKGRAYKEALGLRKVIAAEEAGDSEEASKNQQVTPVQIKLVDKLCKAQKLNVMEVVNLGKTKFDDINDMTQEQIRALIKYLNQCQQNKRPCPKVSPYNPNWRD